MKLLEGVVTAMVTPFDKSGDVDLSSIRRLTEFLVERKVHCLYPTGTTGEMFLLSVEERKKVARTVVETAAGRLTTYIHAGAMNLRDTLELVHHARDIGADGVGIVTPSFFSVNEREMEEYYISISRSVPDDFPIYLYNIPQCSANDLKPGTAARIADRCPNVVGIKYSWPDLLRTGEYLRIRNGGFSVVIGADRLLVPGLALGCAGTVSGVSCVCPEPFVAIYDAFRNGDLEQARRLQLAATAICETLKNGSNMAYFKAALAARGVEVGPMRSPLQELPREEAELVSRQLASILSELSISMRSA